LYIKFTADLHSISGWEYRDIIEDMEGVLTVPQMLMSATQEMRDVQIRISASFFGTILSKLSVL
jgi:hypothetical protein